LAKAKIAKNSKSKHNNHIEQVSSSIPKVGTLEEKDQYVTIAFTTTYDYLVFATNFFPFVTIVTSC
jgi:uncharacterized protein (DUF1499 family)